MPPLRLSKNPFGLFRQTLAACCAHNLSPDGGQIPQKTDWTLFAANGGKLCEAFLTS